MRNRLLACVAGACVAAVSPSAFAGGGPFGIDSPTTYDDSGIWKRGNQKLAYDLVVGGVIVGALWEGSDSRLGRTFWQSTDAMLVGQLGYAVLNAAAGRLRPSQTDDPNQWRKGGHSFP